MTDAKPTGCIIKVFWHDDARMHRNAPFSFIQIASNEFETFLKDVDTDTLMRGDQLWTKRTDDRSGLIIFRRQPVAFRGDCVDRAQLAFGTFEEVLE